MKIKLLIVIIGILFVLVAPVYANLYQVGDEVIFTYRKEKVTGTLKKIKVSKIYVGNDNFTMGYKRRKMLLKDRAKFYSDDKKEYDEILEKRKEAEKQKNEKAAELLKKSPYKYLGKPITIFQFHMLTFKSIGILYATTSGIVIDMLRDSSTARYKRLYRECEIGDRGYFSGKILQVLNRKILVSDYYRSTLYIYCIDNIDTKNMVENREYSGNVIMKSAFKYNSTLGAPKSVPLLEPLRSPTNEELQKYFTSGKKLYYFKEVAIPATYKICKNCKGSGKVLRGKGSLTYIKCPRCGGMKNIKVSNKQTYYKKVYIEKISAQVDKLK